MAVPTFVAAGTSVINSATASIAFPVPAGVAANDIVLAHLYKENNAAVTPPAGFTQVGTPAAVTTGNAQWHYLFWKRATGADSGTYTFTWTGSTYNSGQTGAYRGCITSGTPVELSTSAVNTTSTTTTPNLSFTTTGADRLLVWAGTNFSESNWTAPTGFTLRGDSTAIVQAFATRNWPTAGATGNVSGTSSTSNTNTAWLTALVPVASGSTTVAPTEATLSVAAQNATVSTSGGGPPAVTVVETVEAFTTTATATATFATAPPAGSLVLGIVSTNKNAGTFTGTPAGFTVRRSYVNLSVSGAIADATAVNGGTWTWSGTGVNGWGVVGFIETDVTNWTHHSSIVVPTPVSDTTATSMTADLGTATGPGVVFAVCGVDSSWDDSGPFATTSTITWTNGYTTVGVWQDTPLSTSPYGGAAFIVGKKSVASGDTTSTTLSWTGGADQAWMALSQYNVTSVPTSTTANATEATLAVAAQNATVNTASPNPAPTEAILGVSALNASVTTDTGTPGTLTSAWLGIDSINLRLTGGTGVVRVDFSLASDMSSPVSSTNVTPTANGDAHVTIPALTPDTTYYYRAFRGGSYIGTAQQFRSLPAAGGFVFGFASCRDTALDADVLSTLGARGADFFLNLGDIHYRDINSTTASNYRTAYDDLLNYADLANTLKGIPNTYVWSDHDFCGNASDRTFTGKATVQQVYRERVPHLTLPSATGGIYQTFKQGRVRFILLDTRSFRDSIGTTADGTMLGTEQLNWLQGLLATPDTPLTFIISAEGWHSSGSDDDWGFYQNERTTIAGWITASSTEVVFLCGDMHSVTYATAAQGTPGGVHVWHGAALNQFDNGVKGGPYAVTPYYHSSGQYGLVTVADTGASITATFNVVRQGTSDWANSDSVVVDTSTDAVAGVATTTVAGQNAAISTSQAADAGAASLGVAAENATILTSITANAQVATLLTDAQSASAGGQLEVTATAAAVGVAAQDAVFTSSAEAALSSGSVGVQGQNATVSTSSNVTVEALDATLGVAALNPAITTSSATVASPSTATLGVAPQNAEPAALVAALQATLTTAAQGATVSTSSQVNVSPESALLGLAAYSPTVDRVQPPDTATLDVAALTATVDSLLGSGMAIFGVAAADALITIGHTVTAQTADFGVDATAPGSSAVMTPLVAYLTLMTLDPEAVVPEVFGTIAFMYRSAPTILAADRPGPAIIGVRRGSATILGGGSA